MFPRAVTALRRTQPVIEYIRPYGPDLIGWITKFGQAAVELRRQRPLRAHLAALQRLPVHARRRPATCSSRAARAQRLDGLQFGKGDRCPGGAIQPAPDGSNPWRDTERQLDCDPTDVPPGP